MTQECARVEARNIARDADLARKIADAEAAIAARAAERAAAESVAARKCRNAAEAKRRAAMARSTA